MGKVPDILKPADTSIAPMIPLGMPDPIKEMIGRVVEDVLDKALKQVGVDRGEVRDGKFLNSLALQAKACMAEMVSDIFAISSSVFHKVSEHMPTVYCCEVEEDSGMARRDIFYDKELNISVVRLVDEICEAVRSSILNALCLEESGDLYTDNDLDIHGQIYGLIRLIFLLIVGRCFWKIDMRRQL